MGELGQGGLKEDPFALPEVHLPGCGCQVGGLWLSLRASPAFLHAELRPVPIADSEGRKLGCIMPRCLCDVRSLIQ